MPSVLDIITYVAGSAIPIYLWAKLIQTYLAYKRELRIRTLFYEKHNCVVTYSKDAGMYGWPDYKERLPMNLNSYQKFLEPILYFINTATHRIDISVMVLTCQNIIEALGEAAEKGVMIRIILDAGYNDMRTKMKILMKKGVKIMYDQKSINTDTMMHNKYAVKDFEPDGTGFTLCGSLNWTQSAFSENYEFMVLSTNSQVVGAFNKNFEETWKYLQQVYDTNNLTNDMYPV